MIHLQNNIPLEPRRALQWCHNQNMARWSVWQLKTNNQKVYQKKKKKNYLPLKLSFAVIQQIYFQPHYLRTDIRSWPPLQTVLFVSFVWHCLTWSSCLGQASPYLPIWTLLGKAPIVSPQTQENSSKSWLQEILILLVQICERHWGWRQLGKGQKGETLLEIHSCRVFPLQWHVPWCDSVRR